MVLIAFPLLLRNGPDKPFAYSNAVSMLKKK